MYAKIKNQIIVKYPYTIDELRADNPDTSFPASPTTNQLIGFDAVEVLPDPQPSCDTYTQSIDEALPEFVRGEWRQRWVVRDATNEEMAERKQSNYAVFENLTQRRLDDFARTRGYNSITVVTTYATSAVQKFKAEGQYAVTARDQTWQKLYEIMAQIDAGTRPMPSGFAEIEPELPPLVWPV